MTDAAAEHFYDLPLYYDIAFDWDVTGEVELFEQAFDEQGTGALQRVLEPACGTGRMLRALAKRGYDLLGYDVNAKMVAFARQHTPDEVNVVQADMTDAVFSPTFDAALCPINSLGHLQTDERVAKHFDAVGRSLRIDGVYVIQLSSVYEDLGEFDPEHWTAERDGVSVEITWRVVSEDIITRRALHHSTLVVNDHGVTRVFEEDHAMRVWTYDDIQRLVGECDTLTLAAVYDEDGVLLAPTTPITGETGNLYYALRRV